MVMVCLLMRVPLWSIMIKWCTLITKDSTFSRVALQLRNSVIGMSTLEWTIFLWFFTIPTKTLKIAPEKADSFFSYFLFPDRRINCCRLEGPATRCASLGFINIHLSKSFCRRSVDLFDLFSDVWSVHISDPPTALSNFGFSHLDDALWMPSWRFPVETVDNLAETRSFRERNGKKRDPARFVIVNAVCQRVNRLDRWTIRLLRGC